MYPCTYCKENSVRVYFDRYDNEVYMKCSLCGRTAEKPVCTLCTGEITEGGYADTEKDIYCAGCFESITV